MIGSRLSHYLISEPIGAGGMGVVYRARDERLERDVALKVLPTGALADESARKQFRREALALSKLNHPNIATVHDFDTQEGVDFLVLELVPGETLAERVSRGPLPEKEIARLGEQLAEGLAAAHKQGVLHRDIKPANLRVTPEGRLKILDFGLARLARVEGGVTATATVTGTVAGTVPYMSPEQLRGEALDERADVWAVGAVLYELATGHRAFDQEPQARLIAAILQEAVVPPREAGARVSPELERIALKCLEKDREDRYQSARELAVDLRRLLAPSAGSLAAGARKPARRRLSSTALIGAALAVAIVAAAGLLLALNLGGMRDRLLPPATAISPSLAVLPLANLSGDPSQEFFADGMTDELISTLAQVGSMRVISRTSSVQFKGSKKSMREIAKDLGVRMIVEGSVLRAGDAVRITAQLIDAIADRSLWSETFERDPRNVLRLQSEVARAIVDRIAVRLTPQERGRLAAAREVVPEAHEAYLRGRYYFNKNTEESARSAIAQFERAIELDPGYATAYAGLADAYCEISSAYIPAAEAMPKAKAAAAKALEIDPQLAAAHVSLAYVQSFYEWDWERGEKTFRRALELNPNEATAHAFLGQQLMVRRRFKEASAQISQACRIDPLSPYFGMMRLWPIYYGRRYDDAIVEARKLVEVDPGNHSPHWVIGQSLAMKGDLSHAIPELARACEIDSRPFYLGWLGWAYGRAGDTAKAMEIVGRLRGLSASGEVPSYALAAAFTGMGERDSAFAWLNLGVDQRLEDTLLLDVESAYDPLRGDPRYAAILRRLNLGG